MSALEPPFEIQLSNNAMRFVFTDSWDHVRHYQAVFNSQADIVPSHMPNGRPFGMVTDWREWLVLVPECERLCIRCLSGHMDLGMTHYAVVVDDHPVVKWQADKVKASFPELECGFFKTFSEAYEWLHKAGFDVDFEPVEFNCQWLNMTPLFADVVHSLSDVNPANFGLKERKSTILGDLSDT